MNINIQKFLSPVFENGNNNSSDLRLAVQNGFPFSVFEAVQKETGLTQKQMATILGASVRTIARRKENNHFNAIESDILYRVARVLAYAVTVFGDIGSQQVEDVLHRINYGIYS